MAKDEIASAKIELISKLLSPDLLESGSSDEPKKKKKQSKRAGTPVSKVAKSRAQREKAGQKELAKHMRKPRTEPIGRSKK